MVAKRETASVAAYYLMFGHMALQQHIRRHRLGPKSRSRLRNRRTFAHLQAALSPTVLHIFAFQSDQFLKKSAFLNFFTNILFMVKEYYSSTKTHWQITTVN
jgi:hypothetical protein